MKADFYNYKWSTIIKPKVGLLDVNIKEIMNYAELVKIFIYRDFVVYYKQTVLGPAWWFIQPLFTSGMFTIIFSAIANISTDSLPPILFYLTGVVIWNFFSDCLQNTANTFISNKRIMSKVFFPRLIVPISIIGSGLIKLSIQLILLLIVYLIYYTKGACIYPSVELFFLPLAIIYVAFLSLGFGILISSVTIKYRDVSLTIPFFVQLWMFATPIVYPISQIPSQWKMYYLLNPMVLPVEFMRKALLGSGTITFSMIFSGFLITSCSLIIGVIFFNRVEKSFMDTI